MPKRSPGAVEFRRGADPRDRVLSTEIWLPAPREGVFEFFADAFQLEAITPPWLHFHVATPRPIAMAAGTLIDYRLRLHGIPVKWRTEISAWEPPVRFIDRQISGPYVKWEHEHTFSERDGGTLMRDEVVYRVPGGRLFGGLVNRFFVESDLRRIFEYRRAVMQKFFAPGPDGVAART